MLGGVGWWFNVDWWQGGGFSPRQLLILPQKKPSHSTQNLCNMKTSEKCLSYPSPSTCGPREHFWKEVFPYM